MIILCDIDGVLADCNHRLHYLKEKDYDKFYGTEMADDKFNCNGATLYRALTHHAVGNTRLVLLTGRSERTRSLTELWLYSKDIKYDKLAMRKDGDHRPSPKVKVELIKKNLTKEQLKYEDIWFIDDDPENVKAVCEAFPQIIGITFGIGRM